MKKRIFILIAILITTIISGGINSSNFLYGTQYLTDTLGYSYLIIEDCEYSIDTSVNLINPYNVSSSPLTINATGNATSDTCDDDELDNVTLYYRFSNDNSTWSINETRSDESNNTIDSNTSDVDGSVDIGVESNFVNAQDIAPDSDVMNILENETAGSDSESLDNPSFTGGTTSWTLSGMSYDAVDFQDTAGSCYDPGGDPATNYVTQDGYDSYLSTDVVIFSCYYMVAHSSGGSGTSLGSCYVEIEDESNPGTWTTIYTVFENNQASHSWTSTSDQNVSASFGTGNYRLRFRIYTEESQVGYHRTNLDNCHLSVDHTDSYKVDFEYQWTTADFDEPNEEVCIYVDAHTGSENLNVNYWTGSSWSSLGSITGIGWTNLTATELTSATYTIQFIGASDSGDGSQDDWDVDAIFLHTWDSTNISELVDDNSCDVDGSADIGVESNFVNAQDIAPDSDVMNILENETAGTSESLDNPSFTSGTTSWTLSGMSYDAADFQDTAGSCYDPGGDPATNYVTQDGYDSYLSTDVVTFSCYYMVDFDDTGSGTCLGSCYVEIEDESNPGTWTPIYTVFENNQADHGWTSTGDQNVSGFFGTGNYRLRFRIYTEESLLGYHRTNLDNCHLFIDLDDNYKIDFEYQWTSVDFNMSIEEICIYVAAHTGSEDLNVNYWTGSSWSSLGSISGTGWTNLTATDLSSGIYTIQLVGASESNDESQDDWDIDVMYLHTWNWVFSSGFVNPDEDSPWSWDFTFPDGVGYYEFYSIGKMSGLTDELPPNSADARCNYTG